jgi:hypothetical protein
MRNLGRHDDGRDRWVVSTPNRVSERVLGKLAIVNENMIALEHGDGTPIAEDYSS